MKKRILIIALLLSFILIASACGNFDLACEIKDNTATMTLNINIPKDTLSESQIEHMTEDLELLGLYWKKQGWDINYNNDKDAFSYNLSMTAEGEDMESTYEKMIELMSLDIAPFSSVEGGYSTGFFSDIYTISATVDLTKMLNYEYIDNELPPSQREDIYEAIGTFSGTVTFTFPGETVQYIGNTDGTSIVADLNLNDPVAISQTLRYDNAENIDTYSKLLTNIDLAEQSAQKDIYILAGLLLFVVIMLILVIIFAVKRRKSQKQWI